MLGFNVEDAIAMQCQLDKFIVNIEDEWVTLQLQWDHLKNCWHDHQYNKFESYFNALSEGYTRAIKECRVYYDFLSMKIREAKDLERQQSLIMPLIQASAVIVGTGLVSNNPTLLIVGLPSLLGFLNQLNNLGGGHKYQYQKERERFLIGLANDPKAPKEVRQWIKQEQNRIWNIQKLRATGRLAQAIQNAKMNKDKDDKKQKLRVSKYIKSPPGYDVGHYVAGVDMSSNFRLELASMNRARPHTAKNLGLPGSYF